MELIKNFANLREYMKEFYIYGFKTREEYDAKSARSYDNMRRRIQSYLGDLVGFHQMSSGKTAFISVAGNTIIHNPLYRAFKSKSFTDKDITLHFILLDIMQDGSWYTLKDIIECFDTEYAYRMQMPMCFDESTVRKKIKEYVQLGIFEQERQGKNIVFRVCKDDVDLSAYKEAIDYFSEENPLGIIGSYLLDRIGDEKGEYISFKNHYIMNAYDAEVLEAILQGIHEGREITIDNYSRKKKITAKWTIVPLKLYCSVQGGRNYLIARKGCQYHSFRVDYIKSVKLGEIRSDYPRFKQRFEERISHNMWGVACWSHEVDSSIEVDIHIEPDEKYIVEQLYRERRNGSVVKLDDTTYRYTGVFFDTYEMVPWLRGYIGRIKRLECTNPRVKDVLKDDLRKMAEWYEVEI